MCGIVGWVNLEEDISKESNIVLKMATELSRRGPDDSEIYACKNAILGHRRLVVVDPIGGKQPMTKTINGNTYTIVYNGELYNTDELREKLLKKGYEFNSYSDTEVLLVSYIEWEEECVKYLNGIYAFGIWNERKKTLFAARDPLGVKPFFYTIKEDSFLFASEIKGLLANPCIDAVLDRNGLTEIFSLGPARSLGSGILKGIYEIPPAHCLNYNRTGIRMWEYWKLKSIKHQESIDETSEHLRFLITDAIKRQLVGDVPVCTFLSGGLDSSLISSIAAAEFKKSGRAILNTYSIDYIDNNLNFKADDYQPDSDNLWTYKVSEYIRSRHHEVLLDTNELVTGLYDAVCANDLPGMADIDSSLLLFCKRVKQDATVALSGECADEIFGGYPWFRRQEDVNSNTFPWSPSLSERKALLSEDYKDIPIEEFSTERYLESINKVDTVENESPVDKRMRELFYLNIKWFMVTLLTRKDRMSMWNSLEVRVPYADYRLVEYAYNIPWKMKFCDGIEKGIVRRAFKGVLPDDVLYRKKSPYPKTHNPNYTQSVQFLMKKILSDKQAPINQIINRKNVSEIVETGGESFGKPWFGQLMKGPQLIAYLIQLNLWLMEYNIKIL